MRRVLGGVLIGAATSLVAWVPAQAAVSVVLDGSYAYAITKPAWTGTRCPAGTADECGVFNMVGLGLADYAYVYGPTFEPTGKKGCFYVDGTFTITLQSDGSTVSGPLTGIFCGPGNSHAQAGTPSYGNPQGENDTIAFSGGTGQFSGLSGTVAFSEFDAGAYFEGSLKGTLSG
jgi:hypothetical protein